MSDTHFSELPATPEAYRRWWRENTDQPYGLCWCGCGKLTTVAESNSQRHGHVKDEPKRFAGSHYQAYKSRAAAEHRKSVPESKVCVVCGKEKPIGEFYKGSVKARYKDGYRNECRACHQGRAKYWRDDNREERAAYNRAYLKANPERRRAYKETQRERNGDEIRRKSLEKYHRNKEHYAAKAKEWRAANPGKIREAADRRRARVREQAVGRVDYAEILKRDGYWCYLCEQDVAPKDVSYDHVIPLSKGGPHSMDNIRITHWKCNHKKGNRLL